MQNGEVDIVVRLRERAFSFKSPDKLVEEAADVIESLRKQVASWERCSVMTREMFGNCIVPKISTGATGNQWFTIPERSSKDENV